MCCTPGLSIVVQSPATSIVLRALVAACSLTRLQVLQRQMPRLGDSMVVGSLWAFAVAGVLPSGLFQEGLLKLASLPADKARPLLLLQLFQAITLLQVRISYGAFFFLHCGSWWLVMQRV
jgi:hypothetical protein